MTVELTAGGQTRLVVVNAGLTIGERNVGDRIVIVYDEADPSRAAIAGLAPPRSGPAHGATPRRRRPAPTDRSAVPVGLGAG